MKAVAAANVTVIPAKKNRLSMDIVNNEVRKACGWRPMPCIHKP